MESMTLHEAIISMRLREAGLPMTPRAQAVFEGSSPASDPYAVPASAQATLSGMGQLLGASDWALEGINAAASIATVAGSGGKTVSSTQAGVATATIGASAELATYEVSVTRIATAMQQRSTAVIADATASIFSAGSFSLEMNGQTSTVTMTGSSLNELVSSINSANAGVTAEALQGDYGYQLQISANQTGGSSAFTLAANDDVFNPWKTFLAQLGMTESRAAQDALYTVNAGDSQTSATNTISLATDVDATLVAAGSTQIKVEQAPDVPATLEAVTNYANTLVNNYNALRGTLNTLTNATDGALKSETSALDFSAAIFADTQAEYTGTFTLLTQIGLDSTGESSTLEISSTTLESAYNANATATAQLLTDFADRLKATINTYAQPQLGGRIIDAAASLQQNMAFMNNQPASASPLISGPVKQLLLEQSVYESDSAPALPRINVFA